ncbi:hypothetical protein PR048_023954 [Dryococelus australis]|uniref:Uncharacterized protein n=1 Tax=Dryococelus australis TaxID=614101 RepID=A0ABQ9GVH3_9NEOP|nr:hypothetical protein PR048_023954 [Dryococelus australis]
MWEPSRTMPLVDGFSRGSPVPPPPPIHSDAAPYSLQSPSSALKTSLLDQISRQSGSSNSRGASSLAPLCNSLGSDELWLLCRQTVAKLDVSGGYKTAKNPRMKRRWNARTGKAGVPRENPPASGIRPARFPHAKIRPDRRDGRRSAVATAPPPPPKKPLIDLKLASGKAADRTGVAQSGDNSRRPRVVEQLTLSSEEEGGRLLVGVADVERGSRLDKARRGKALRVWKVRSSKHSCRPNRCSSRVRERRDEKRRGTRKRERKCKRKEKIVKKREREREEEQRKRGRQRDYRNIEIIQHPRPAVHKPTAPREVGYKNDADVRSEGVRWGEAPSGNWTRRRGGGEGFGMWLRGEPDRCRNPSDFPDAISLGRPYEELDLSQISSPASCRAISFPPPPPPAKQQTRAADIFPKHGPPSAGSKQLPAGFSRPEREREREKESYIVHEYPAYAPFSFSLPRANTLVTWSIYLGEDCPSPGRTDETPLQRYPRTATDPITRIMPQLEAPQFHNTPSVTDSLIDDCFSQLALFHDAMSLHLTQADDISWHHFLLLANILQRCLTRLEPFRMRDEIFPVI